MIAHVYARHVPAHARIGRYVADQGKLSWVFPFLHQIPSADVLLTGGTARDAVIGRANHGIHVLVHGVPEPTLHSWLQAKNVAKDFDISIPSNGLTRHHTLPLNHDLARRDITANALAYSIRDGILHDPFDGLKDIEDRKIRAIGDAKARFHENPLLLPRLLRLATELGFTVEEKTWEALKASAHKVNQIVSNAEGKAEFAIRRSHLGKEFLRSLRGHAADTFKHLRESGLLYELAPKMRGLETLERVSGKKMLEELETVFALLHEEHAPVTVILAAILSFFEEGAEDMLEHLSDHLHLPMLDDLSFSYHDLSWLLAHRNVLEQADPRDLPPAEFERVFGGTRGHNLLMLLKALYRSQGRHSEGLERLYAAEARKASMEETGHPKLLRGRDLLSLGLEPGHHLRSVMQKVRDAQLSGKISSKIDALDFARHLMATGL